MGASLSGRKFSTTRLSYRGYCKSRSKDPWWSHARWLQHIHYHLTLNPLAIADASGKIYQPTAKHLFRNELIKLSCDSIEKNPPKNAVHIYDGMAIVRSVAPQKTWGDLRRLFLNTQPIEEH